MSADLIVDSNKDVWLSCETMIDPAHAEGSISIEVPRMEKVQLRFIVPVSQLGRHKGVDYVKVDVQQGLTDAMWPDGSRIEMELPGFGIMATFITRGLPFTHIITPMESPADENEFHQPQKTAH